MDSSNKSEELSDNVISLVKEELKDLIEDAKNESILQEL